MKYQYHVLHVPGNIADTPSHVQSSNANLDDSHVRTEVDAYVNAIMNTFQQPT